MSILQEITECVDSYSDWFIETLMQKYEQRKYNICIKMEHGIYTQEQAERNYERASKIYTVLFKEKNRRMLEQDKVIRDILKSGMLSFGKIG